jgi:hypothetical protein
MKKVILAVAVLIGVSSASFGFVGEGSSNNSTSIELIANSELQFKLAVENLKVRSSVVIKDQSGQVLYSATLPKSGNYSKIFDLSGLADGSYSFVVNNGGEVTAKPFEISTETKRVVTAIK